MLIRAGLSGVHLPITATIAAHQFAVANVLSAKKRAKTRL